MAKNTDYESVVAIEEHALDQECIKLPTDLLRFSTQAAEARRDMDEAKASLDVVEADLSRAIRANPSKYGLEKDTKDAVAAAVALQPQYRTAQEELQQAKYELDLVSAVVSALEAKKRALTLLVDLHGMGYFANVKVSAKGKEAILAENAKKAARRYRGDAD